MKINNHTTLMSVKNALNLRNFLIAPILARVSPDCPGPDSGIPAIFGSPGPGPGTGHKFRSGSGSGSGFTKDPANPDYFSSTNFMIFNPINFFNNDDFEPKF